MGRQDMAGKAGLSRCPGEGRKGEVESSTLNPESLKPPKTKETKFLIFESLHVPTRPPTGVWQECPNFLDVCGRSFSSSDDCKRGHGPLNVCRVRAGLHITTPRIATTANLELASRLPHGPY